MLGQMQHCPCGEPSAYDACCGRLHRGADQAPTAVALMRSRYAAYVVGDADYVWRTWHPATRPERIDLDDDTAWTGLTVHDSGDDWVEFTARYAHGSETGALHELSRFERRAGRWFYRDGDLS